MCPCKNDGFNLHSLYFICIKIIEILLRLSYVEQAVYFLDWRVHTLFAINK